MRQSKQLFFESTGQKKKLHGVYIVSFFDKTLEGSFYRLLSVTREASLLLETEAQNQSLKTKIRPAKPRHKL